LKPETVEQISKAAVQAALEYLEKEKARQKKAKKDWRRRNTKLLLRNYRGFVKHSKEAQEKFEVTRWDDSLEELYTEEFAIESIRKSKARTLEMVRFIQRMLVAFKAMCEATGKPEDVRRYQVIDSMYISDKIMSAEEIAEFHKVEVRTVYNDVNNACEALSVLIFGVDAVHFE
jgi:hypothetical protein